MDTLSNDQADITLYGQTVSDNRNNDYVNNIGRDNSANYAKNDKQANQNDESNNRDYVNQDTFSNSKRKQGYVNRKTLSENAKGEGHKPGGHSRREGGEGKKDTASGNDIREKTADGVIGTYKSDDADINITQYTYEDTKVYVADVTLGSAEYLKTAFAEDTYGRNITESTSEMADSNNAVLAINGDNYGSQEKGYVIRNGIIYRDDAGNNEVLCVYSDGSMEVIGPDEYTAEELVDKGVWQAFSFGPSLIESGKISVSEDDEVGKAKASNPRTAIGIIDDLHYIFVVSDGRTDTSEGLSLYELAELMQSKGAVTAYNLDGGGSSTMVFNGSLINNPTTTGTNIKERKVNDIVYIG
ncbi:MAG: phosphodiester glycosidase family protein [Lachnospiraceae bacterium]|nr:phosphodiester glycosidase family protein [Lachnospiraceae bacterium]